MTTSAYDYVMSVCHKSGGELSWQLVEIDTKNRMFPGFSAVHWDDNREIMTGFVYYKDAWNPVRDAFLAHVVIRWVDRKPCPVAAGYSWEELAGNLKKVQK